MYTVDVNNQHRRPYILGGVALLIIAAVALSTLLVLRSQTDSITQQVGTGNVAAIHNGVTISQTSYGGAAATVTLAENATVDAYIHGTVTDGNGCEQVDSPADYSGKFYRTNNPLGTSCVADNNDCYDLAASDFVVDQCTPGGSDITARYQATKPIQYYADPTDVGSPNAASNWTATVTVNDGTVNSTAEATTEMGSLVALNVTDGINYGSLDLGAISITAVTATLTNTGNRNMDATVAGSGDMACTSGTIPVGNAHYSLSQLFVYAVGTALSTAEQNMQNNTTQRTNDAVSSTTDTFWKIQMPASGVTGTCTNTVTFTAQADS